MDLTPFSFPFGILGPPQVVVLHCAGLFFAFMFCIPAGPPLARPWLLPRPFFLQSPCFGRPNPTRSLRLFGFLPSLISSSPKVPDGYASQLSVMVPPSTLPVILVFPTSALSLSPIAIEESAGVNLSFAASTCLLAPYRRHAKPSKSQSSSHRIRLCLRFSPTTHSCLVYGLVRRISTGYSTPVARLARWLKSLLLSFLPAARLQPLSCSKTSSPPSHA